MESLLQNFVSFFTFTHVPLEAYWKSATRNPYVGSGTRDPGPSIWGTSPGPRDSGPGTFSWDPRPRTLQLGPFTWDLGPFMWEPGPITFKLNAGPILRNPYINTALS